MSRPEGTPQTPATAVEEFLYPNFENAACRGLDPEIFFPKSTHEAREVNTMPTLPYQYYPGKSIKPLDIAKETCRRCEHLTACRDFALDNKIRYGIWGATTETDRRRLQKELNN